MLPRQSVPFIKQLSNLERHRSISVGWRRNLSVQRSRRTRTRVATARPSQLLDDAAQNNLEGLSSSSSSSSILEAIGNDENENLSGDAQTFDDYLKKANLSPWVPTPDMVGRAMLELADAGRDDIHFDLGSGDGRLNFLACEEPFYVRSSIGVDVDQKLINFSKDRAKVLISDSQLNVNDQNLEPISEGFLADSINYYRPDVDFFCADLLSENLNQSVDLSKASIITMYFVESALKKLQPILERQLGGSGCRIVTNKYKFESEWAEPTRVEVVSGLPIHLYVLD